MQKLTVEFRAVIRNPDTGLYGQSAEFEITACPDLLKNLDLGDELNMMFHEAFRKSVQDDPRWHDDERGYHVLDTITGHIRRMGLEPDEAPNAHS